MSIVTLYYQSLFIINKKLMILLNIEKKKKNIALWIVQPNTLKIAAPVISQQLIVFIIIIIIPLGNSAPSNDSAPPVMSWFINPINQFVISTIKHRILPLIRQLNINRTGGPSCCHYHNHYYPINDHYYHCYSLLSHSSP